VLRWLLVEVLRALSIAPGLSGISLQVRRVAFEAGDEAFPTTASLRGRPRWSGLAFMAPFPRREHQHRACACIPLAGAWGNSTAGEGAFIDEPDGALT
jgi:hypothetical protein